MNYSGIINCSIVDGDGFRVALFLSGCRHHCIGCHNKDTWDFNNGKPYTEEVENVLFDRLDKPYVKGLTLTGGDPLYHKDEVLNIVTKFRERFGNTKDIWLYTGFTMNEIIERGMKNIINNVDVVVDGRFVLEKRDISLAFRGSTNQIIWEKDKDGNFVKSKLNGD